MVWRSVKGMLVTIKVITGRAAINYMYCSTF